MSFDFGRLVDSRIIQRHIQDAAVSCAGIGANTVLVNASSKHLVVLQYVLDCATPGNTVTWQDGDGVAKSGAMPFAETGGLVAPYSPIGHFMLAAGQSLVLNLSAAAQVSGHLSYVLI